MAGRPRFTPTQEQRDLVAALRYDDFPLSGIAARVGVSLPTLRQAFRLELLVNDPQVRINAAVSMVSKAMKGNVGAIMVLDKALGIFKPPKVNPLTGAPTAPQMSSVEHLVSQMKGLKPHEKKFFLENTVYMHGCFVTSIRLNLGDPETAGRIKDTAPPFRALIGRDRGNPELSRRTKEAIWATLDAMQEEDHTPAEASAAEAASPEEEDKAA